MAKITPRTYDGKTLAKITQLGTYGYALSKVMNIMEITDRLNFTMDFYNPESVVYQSYHAGRDKGDFMIDSILFEEATKKKDLNAAKEFTDRKKKNIAQADKEERLYKKK